MSDIESLKAKVEYDHEQIIIVSQKIDKLNEDIKSIAIKTATLQTFVILIIHYVIK